MSFKQHLSPAFCLREDEPQSIRPFSLVLESEKRQAAVCQEAALGDWVGG